MPHETIRDRVESRDGSSIDYILNKRDKEGWKLVTVVKVIYNKVDDFSVFDLYFRRKTKCG